MKMIELKVGTALLRRLLLPHVAADFTMHTDPARDAVIFHVKVPDDLIDPASDEAELITTNDGLTVRSYLPGGQYHDEPVKDHEDDWTT